MTKQIVVPGRAHVKRVDAASDGPDGIRLDRGRIRGTVPPRIDRKFVTGNDS